MYHNLTEAINILFSLFFSKNAKKSNHLWKTNNLITLKENLFLKLFFVFLLIKNIRKLHLFKIFYKDNTLIYFN